MKALSLTLLLSVLVWTIGFYPGWFDSGELATASFGLGVTHPTGHPVWVILSNLFGYLPVGSIAFRLAFFSSICFVLALYCFYKFQDSYPFSSLTLVGFSILLLLHPSIALQVSRIEVYSLTFLLFILFFSLTLRFLQTGEIKTFWLSAFCFGLFFTLHPLIALSTSPLGIVPLIQQKVKPKMIWIGLLFFILGSAPFLFIPIRSFQNPILNWGAPIHWNSLLHFLRAKDYNQFFHSVTSSKAKTDLLKGDFFTLIPMWLFLFSMGGLFLQWKKDRSIFWVLTLGLLFSSLPWLLKDFHLQNPDAHAYVMVPIFFILLLSFSLFRNYPNLSSPLLAVSLLFHSPNHFNLLRESTQIRFICPAQSTPSPPLSKVSLTSDNWIFPAWYRQEVEKRRPDLTLIAEKMVGAGWYKDQISKRHPEVSLSQIQESTMISSDPFLEICKERWKENEIFEIQKTTCALVFYNELQNLKISRVESVLSLPESHLSCGPDEPLKIPYPLSLESQENFMVSPKSLVTDLLTKYIQCKNLKAVEALYNKYSELTNVRLLYGYVLWGFQKPQEALIALESRSNDSRTEKGYLALARSTIYYHSLHDAKNSELELLKSKNLLGETLPVTRMESTLKKAL